MLTVRRKLQLLNWVLDYGVNSAAIKFGLTPKGVRGIRDNQQDLLCEKLNEVRIADEKANIVKETIVNDPEGLVRAHQAKLLRRKIVADAGHHGRNRVS